MQTLLGIKTLGVKSLASMQISFTEDYALKNMVISKILAWRIYSYPYH